MRRESRRASGVRVSAAVKGSTRRAARTNCTMTAMPHEHEQAVENARADLAEREQVGDRPAAGEGGAEHFRADQDRPR